MRHTIPKGPDLPIETRQIRVYLRTGEMGGHSAVTQRGLWPQANLVVSFVVSLVVSLVDGAYDKAYDKACICGPALPSVGLFTFRSPTFPH
jgi:hypothetical protein